MANLSELEEHLLHRLASATVTRSSVALAAELWDGDNSPFTYDMVRWVLTDMNKSGLVTYFVAGSDEIPVQIRVTDAGYNILGYTQRHLVQDQLGHRHREDSMRPADGTDFRNHRYSAEWAPCERLSIEDHRRFYPDHPHSSEWGYEEYDMQTEARRDALGRPYNSPTGIGSRSANGEEIARIAREEGISIHSAREKVRRRIASEIAAKHPVPANQKQRVLADLLNHGKAQTVAELRKRLLKDNFVIDAHSLVHVLWAMQKDQHITFRQSKRSPVSWEGDLTAIRLNVVGEVAAKKVTMIGAEVMAKADAAMAEVRSNRVVDIAPVRKQIIEQAKEDAFKPREEQTKEEQERLDHVWDVITQPVEVTLPAADSSVKDVPHFEAEKVDDKGTYQFVPETPATPEPPITFFSEFPLIGKMVARQERLETAAKILEEEGESDLALATLEKVSYTDFEKEVLRLVQRVS